MSRATPSSVFRVIPDTEPTVPRNEPLTGEARTAEEEEEEEDTTAGALPVGQDDPQSLTDRLWEAQEDAQPMRPTNRNRRDIDQDRRPASRRRDRPPTDQPFSKAVDPHEKARQEEAHYDYCYICMCQMYSDIGTDGLADEVIRALAFGEHISKLVRAWRASNPTSANASVLASILFEQYNTEVLSLFHAMQPWTMDSVLYHILYVDRQSQVKQEMVQTLARLGEASQLMMDEMVTYQAPDVETPDGKARGPRVLNHACFNGFLKAERQRLQVLNRLHAMDKEQRG